MKFQLGLNLKLPFNNAIKEKIFLEEVDTNLTLQTAYMSMIEKVKQSKHFLRALTELCLH